MRISITHLILVTACLAIAATATAEPRVSMSTVNKSIQRDDNSRSGDMESVNGSIRIGADSVAGSVETVNGGIRIGDGSLLDQVESVNGAISLGENVTIERGIDVVNGTVSMKRGGQVGGDISTVNGALDLRGVTVGGDLTTVNGRIELTDGSEVLGNLYVKKPRGWNWSKQKPAEITIGPDVVIHGKLVFERAVRLDLHKDAKVGEIIGDKIEYVGSDPRK